MQAMAKGSISATLTAQANKSANTTPAADICPEPAGLRDTWNATVDAVLAEATLARPPDGWMQSGGREGRHTEHLGHMLAVMQSVARSFPGAKW
jgi:ring-1,2-phenylacetyl-CoA epoxidase subunit PaaC